MDFPGRLLAIFMALTLIVVFPLQYIAQLHNENITSHINDRTKEFADSLRKKGFIDVLMYEDYIDYLDTTGELYDFGIQDIHPVTGEEISCYDSPEPSFIETESLGSEFKRKTAMLSLSSNPMNETYSLPSHPHREDCYAGHRHDSSCSGYPIIYSYVDLVSSYEYQSSQLDISCGYCNKLFFSMSKRENWNTTGTISIKANGQNYFYSSAIDNVNYNKYRNQLIDLVSELLDYETYSENRTSGLSYSTYGYVPASKNKIELPILGKVDECLLNCKGIPLDISVSGGWNGDTGSPVSNYTFKCNYCRKTMVEARNTHWTSAKSVAIYLNNSICAIYTDTSLIDQIFNGIDKLQKSGDGYVGDNISRNDPMLNYAFIKDGINHGCEETASACKLLEDNTPICNRVVISITATKPNQTVIQGGTIVTTATAIYLDGHKETVNCTSNFNANTIGMQTVTLTCSGLVGNAKNRGTRTCTIAVIVNPNKVLTSINVSPEFQKIERYGAPYFTVEAYYSDGTSKTIGQDKYEVKGFNSSVVGEQNITVAVTENGMMKTASAIINVIALSKICSICNNPYNLNADDSDPGCPFCKDLVTGIIVSPETVEVEQGDPLPITVYAVYQNGSKAPVDRWTCTYNPEAKGLQLVTVMYGGYGANITVWVKERNQICSVCETMYPISEDNCPVCASEVLSITVSPASLTVMQYEPIILTVTAHYANGTSNIVDDWSIDRSSAEEGEYIATIGYGAACGTISLTVISLSSVECMLCSTIYEPSKHPKGCPVCSNTIIGIEAYFSNGSKLVQQGASPNLVVVLVFQDEHRELIADGYILEDYDPYKLGSQAVKIRYEYHNTIIEVEVVNTVQMATCPKGHMYYIDDGDSDPACPYCSTTEEHEIVYYYDITYINEILEVVYKEGIYYFDKGNLITVELTKNDKSALSKMQEMFFRTAMLGVKKRFTFGGEVL